MSFLDLDEILGEEDYIPCKFTVDSPYLGHLDPTNVNDNPLSKGTRVELPLWLVESLSKKNMIEIEIPKYFGPRMRDELTSSSQLSLREFSFYFFQIGLKFSRITKDDDLLRSLRTAFSGERFKTLMARTLTNYFDDMTEFAQTLTSFEATILNEGMKVSRNITKWKEGHGNRLEPSPFLVKLLAAEREENNPNKRSRL